MSGAGAVAVAEPSRRRGPVQPSAPGPGVRTGKLAAVLAAALVTALVVAVAVGSVTVPLADVAAVVGSRLLPGVVDPHERVATAQIVWELRVPRALLGAVVGAGLSVTGACLQALVRNPLADPYVLGVSAGGAFGAVAVTVLGGSVLATLLSVSLAAFLGALTVTLAVFLLARDAGSVSPTRLLLAGVAMAYFATAGMSFLVFVSNDPQAARTVLFWTLGSLGGASFGDLAGPAVVVVCGTGYLMLESRGLNALVTGDDTATSLGVDVARFRVRLLVIASLLTGVLVAVSGAIGFLGLMVPHMARRLVGTDHRRLLPIAALLGALLLVLADVLGRVLARPGEMPVGIVTAAFGVPFFLFLLRRRTPASMAS